ncbi:M48 family metallopeptidase [Dactylosporangium sp. NPDC050588]|uniref:M48 family metallopeptidase n=1 Tax=Dactylosporangium sp. NPDC050588 TaxID=3157211 RepID=UPI0033C16A4D
MTPERCPCCDHDLVTTGTAPAWCPACEWNLGAFDARRAPRTWGLRAGDRADHWLAFRLNRRLYDSLAGRDVGGRGNPVARVAMLLLAAPLALFPPLVLVTGVYLTLSGIPFGPVVGPVLLIGLISAAWPHRRDRHWQPWIVDRAAAPALFALLDRVAAAAGAPMPHEVRLDHDINAYVTVRGLRRRRTLSIGLPLWASLEPQERIGLLAHELGHFVNHDPRRGVVVRTAIGVLRNLLDMLASTLRMGIWMLPLVVVVSPVLWLLSTALLILSGRDSQRAEYLADQVATRVAGSAAMEGLFDGLVVAGGLPAAMAAGHHRHADPHAWRAAAGRLRGAATLDAERTLTLRHQAALLDSHPPTGLRRRMVRSWAVHEPRVAPSDQEWTAIDHDLSPWYAKLAARLRG